MTDETGSPVRVADVPRRRYDMDAPQAVQPGDLLRVRL